MNYYPHHIGDYLRDTAHLTPLEDGIYRRLLDVYYAGEKPLPLETQWVCKLVRARTTDELDAVVEVLRQFFTKQPDGWHNRRADVEIKAHYRRAKAARDNGKRGGRPRNPVGSRKKPHGLAESEFVHNPTESSQNQNQIKKRVVFDAATIQLPEWLNQEVWGRWVADRKARRKPVSEEGAKAQIAKLDEYRAQGHRPEDVINESIANGWQGLFPPSQKSKPSESPLYRREGVM